MNFQNLLPRGYGKAELEEEVTETNEFLTQMENYEGIVICTTNFREVMDRAMQRRFHIMVEFKALTDDGIEILADFIRGMRHQSQGGRI